MQKNENTMPKEALNRIFITLAETGYSSSTYIAQSNTYMIDEVVTFGPLCNREEIFSYQFPFGIIKFNGILDL